jgi:hypothetical protein
MLFKIQKKTETADRFRSDAEDGVMTEKPERTGCLRFAIRRANIFKTGGKLFLKGTFWSTIFLTQLLFF